MDGLGRAVGEDTVSLPRVAVADVIVVVADERDRDAFKDFSVAVCARSAGLRDRVKRCKKLLREGEEEPEGD